MEGIIKGIYKEWRKERSWLSCVAFSGKFERWSLVTRCGAGLSIIAHRHAAPPHQTEGGERNDRITRINHDDLEALLLPFHPPKQKKFEQTHKVIRFHVTVPVTKHMSRHACPLPVVAAPKSDDDEFSLGPVYVLSVFLYPRPCHTLPHAPLHLLSRLERTGPSQVASIRRHLPTRRRERGSHRPPDRAPYLARRGAPPKMVRKIRERIFPEHIPLINK